MEGPASWVPGTLPSPAWRWNNDDADYILSCVTKEDLSSLKCIFKQKYGNPAITFDGFGRNSLHIAASCGKCDVVEWLMNEFAVDIQARDFESGWNALHRSLYYGNIHCAIALLKAGLDFSVLDKDGVNPLKIVLLDSQRAKSFKGDELKLCRVILPYHASEPGELSLEVHELVDIMKEYKATGWAFGRKTGTREKGKFPLNFVAILGEKAEEFSNDAFTEKGHQSDVYLWGNNSNFTLGLGDTKSREAPELVKELYCQSYSVQEVAVSKYHTVFLTEDGSVLSCGQGRGGRLGHGNEQTVLSPKKIMALSRVVCTSVSTANDHSLVLDQMGQVHSFGLNSFHQLGHYPVPQHVMTPKLISSKIIKGKIMVGIAAARFHSAIYTRNELYTFGLNAGQLGHLKGDDWQSVPRLVTRISKKDLQIEVVAVSDGATCCLLSNGDVFLLQDFECRRIATRLTSIRRLVMAGGELKSRALADLQHNKPDSLCVAVLTTAGTVYCWRPGYASFRQCWWAGRKRDDWQVVDICLGKHLIISTDLGVVFHGHFRNSTNKLGIKVNPEGARSISNKNQIKSSMSTKELVEELKRKREDEEEVMIERVPLVYRGYRVSCDAKSRTFAVIQHDPKIGLESSVELKTGSIEEDLETLLAEADLTDNIHDVVVKAKDGTIPAHRFVMASKLKFGTESRLFYDETIGKYVFDRRKYEAEAVKSWLHQVYRSSEATTLLPGFSTKDRQIVDANLSIDNGDFQVIDHFHERAGRMDVSLMESFCLQDLESPTFEVSRTICHQAGELVVGLPVSKRQKKKKAKASKQVPEASQGHKIDQVGHGFRDWQRMTSLSDIRLESENGTVFNCHRCILFSRLDYFRSMLGSPWMESTWTQNTIKMPIPDNILKIILDFVYTDEANVLKDCGNIDLLCQIIVFADQLLIIRLKELCEFSLAKQISLKNCLDLLEFASTYNAGQLQKVCCEFVCNNLTFFLETRGLDSLSVDVLDQLSNVYKSLIPNMAYRMMTPSANHVGLDLVDVDTRSLAVASDPVPAENTKGTLSPRDNVDASKRRRRRRKSSSTREDSLSDGAALKIAGEGSAIRVGPRETASGNNGECVHGHLDFIGTNGVSQYVLEDRSPDSQVQSDKMTLIRKFPAQATMSFKEIMEEEEKKSTNSFTRPILKQTVKPEESRSPVGVHSPPLMKWETSRKKTQRQKKETTKTTGTLNFAHSAEMQQETLTKEPVCPWGKSEKFPVRSFREVMSEESQNEIGGKEWQNQSEQKVTEVVRRKLRWGPLKDEENGIDGRPSTERAWKMTTLATSPPASTASLSEIMKSQLDERDSSSRMLKKPLQVIQMEEKAIEELLQYYKSKDNPEEYVTVQRVRETASCPVWKNAQG